MRTVLIVAYYFPPLGGIGSLRTLGFASHLPDYGWEPTVLAPRTGAYFRDPELNYSEDGVVRTPSIELSRTGKHVLRAGGDDTAAASVTGLRAVARGLARDLLYFPDPQVGWYPPALATARRRLTRDRFDVIFSTSFPITSHLIARRLHRRMRIPWVAEFRDPWSQMLIEQGLSSQRALRLERSLASEATARVMTSPSWAALHERLWGHEVSVIPNGHDGSVAEPAGAGGATATLAYLGSFYPQTQSLEAVLRAVATINRAQPRALRLRFVGELHPALARELRAAGLDEAVEVTGFLPHDHALSAAAESSLLVLAGPRDASGLLRGQVAAKLPEYLATDLPILYAGDLASDAADTLKAFPGTELVAPDDADGAAAAIKRQLGRRYRRDIDGLSRRSLSERLAELLNRVSVGAR